MRNDPTVGGEGRRPNLLFVSREPLTVCGGMETVVRRLMEGLTQRGWRVSFLVARQVKRRPVEILTGDGRPVDLGAYLAEHEIGLVVNNFMFDDGFTRRLAKVRGGIRLINVHHTSPGGAINVFDGAAWAREMRERGWRAWGNPRLVLFPVIFFLVMRNRRSNARQLRINYRLADRFVLLTERLYPEFARVTGLRELAKLRAIPNPCRYDRVTEVAGPRERMLLVVARLTEQDKRLSRVLRMWQALDSAAGSGWRLVIVGDGKDRSNYEAMAAAMKLSNLTFVGEVEDPEPYYRRAAALVVTSAYEGWCVVLSEALQHGVVPVVVDSFASLRDIVEHEGTGLIVPEGDEAALVAAVRRIMTDEELRARLAAKGSASVEWLRLESIVEQWERLIEEVATSGEGAGEGGRWFRGFQATGFVADRSSREQQLLI